MAELSALSHMYSSHRLRHDLLDLGSHLGEVGRQVTSRSGPFSLCQSDAVLLLLANDSLVTKNIHKVDKRVVVNRRADEIPVHCPA